MSDSEVEEMLLELESEMFTLKMDDVLELAQDMKLNEASIKDKSRFVILKSIRQAMEEKVDSLTEKAEIMGYIESIKTFLSPPPLEEISEEPENKEGSLEEKQVLELQEEIDKLLKGYSSPETSVAQMKDIYALTSE